MARSLACLGDKTTHGEIRSASSTWFEGLKAVAQSGDLAWCEVCKGTFQIIGTVSDWAEDRPFVATGDRVMCNCPNHVVIGMARQVVDPIVERQPQTVTVARSTVAEPQQFAQVAKKQVMPTQPVVTETKREAVDAGFCVVHFPSSVGDYGNWLFRQPPTGSKELYSQLNGIHPLKTGSIVIVVDPDKQDANQIESLKKAKIRVDDALSSLTDDEANFMHKHYATIANFSSIADKGIGLAADSAGKYFQQIEEILNKIHSTYKNQYLTRGTLIGEQFFVERRQLFNELDKIIKNGFLGKSLKLGEYTKIKNALGLSTSSIMHEWGKSGVGDIEGYTTHIERSAKLIKAMRYTGYAAIGFSALHSINEVNEACSVGRENECTRKKYTEAGSFTLGTAGGIGGGAAGMWACSLAIGPQTLGAGILLCGLIVGGAMGYAGGEAGGALGEAVGDEVYKVFEQ
ncbi:PAAR domain-containing protein [Yersinia proxima]|uniref:PAAR domain-containing protein n=1 Tax=Yersinia proxima TaxID=2890316 RepID=UPI001D1005BD|nr:PAAR domain-containing protein [Yersinia proxima]